MKRYNFDQIVDRKGTDSYKWDVQDNELPMWVADMDFAILPEVVTAIKERLEVPAFGYCGVPKEYYEAYCSWWKRKHHVDLTIEDMTFSSGVVASIDSIFKHILPKGSGVIIQTPVYHVFEHCIKNNGLKTINNQLLYDGRDYHINFDNLEQLMKNENNKLFLLCNPHNPVGRIWSEEELKKIVSLCEKYDVLLLSDEIHCDIAEPGYEYNSILKYSDKAIALFAPSKVFNLASLHCSCVVSKDHDLLKRIEEGLGQDDLGEPNYFGPYGTIAAFNHGDEWVKEMNEYVFNNKRYMNEFVQRELPKLHLVDSKATYLLWLDISAYTNDSEEFAKRLREETGLFVSNGKQFGKGGETFLRINVATSLDNVKDACNRLKKFVKSL